MAIYARECVKLLSKWSEKDMILNCSAFCCTLRGPPCWILTESDREDSTKPEMLHDATIVGHHGKYRANKAIATPPPQLPPPPAIWHRHRRNQTTSYHYENHDQDRDYRHPNDEDMQGANDCVSQS